MLLTDVGAQILLYLLLNTMHSLIEKTGTVGSVKLEIYSLLNSGFRVVKLAGTFFQIHSSI